MINNLTIVNRQYDYGYDSYYVTRKDESLDFPSDVAIVRSLSPSAYEYSVKDAPLSVKTTIKGTLKTYSVTPSGYLSKVAKHFVVNNERSDELFDEEEDVYIYELNNRPIVTGTLKGTIYNNGSAIQTFVVELGSNTLILSDIGSPAAGGGVRVSSGSYSSTLSKSEILLNWGEDTPTNSFVLVAYSYENSKTTGILTSYKPNPDDYNFVTLTGITTLDTRYVKISSTFKCENIDGNGESFYTNTKSRLFYARCKSFQSLCSSKSNGYVSAVTVCSQRLF